MLLRIVVRGPTDRRLIDAVLSQTPAIGEYAITEAGGASRAVSIAGTLLTVHDDPVVLALDADTTEESLLAEQRSDLQALLNRGGAPSRWCSVQFVPTIECVLLHDESLVVQLFDQPLDEVETALRDVAPKHALERLLARTGSDWETTIEKVRASTAIATTIGEHSEFKTIIDFARTTLAAAA